MHDDVLQFLLAFLGLPGVAAMLALRRKGTACVLLFAASSLLYCFLSLSATETNSWFTTPLSELTLSLSWVFVFMYYMSVFDSKTHMPKLHSWLIASTYVLLVGIPLESFAYWLFPGVASAFKTALVFPVFVLLLKANLNAIRLSIPSSGLLFWGLLTFGASQLAHQFLGWFVGEPTESVTKWVLPLALVVAHTGLWASQLSLATFSNKERTERNRMLRLVSQKMWKSKERYQYLMENSGETMFLLDANFNFLFVGSGITQQLGHHPEQLVGKSFWSLLYWNLQKPSEQSLIEDMKTLVLSNQEVVLPESFRTYRGFEREMQLKLKAFRHGGELEILGQVSDIHNDVLSKYLKKESATFHMRNNLCETDFLSRRLVARLSHFLPKKGVRAVRTALREMLINAVEHGNLRLGFEQKSALLRSNKYFETLNQRKQDRNYAANRIMVRYSLSRVEVRYEIADEGGGFDHELFLNATKSNASNLHGRGILMARSTFDVVRYNEKGNSVTLVKYLMSKKGFSFGLKGN